ncbi:protein KTI12 homolog [Acanthaster planci]|uniref:Protein KTI12 homolog n=1 Tax=Acanthaster planci TaxID=133434 RepID=A0A8B7XMC1_ACAPL|nr:protein KTI12 homolog [Acanthaster planci]XP_022081960.1 protein KTI12 homolog [Acanthaster planci]XP_022081961.1 protein KTI12 homolog [Acanthaster planci]XP_022081963.1 protein KTI12 homolog [Acanthaster planci]XP_022081964.1 protein KTI12 homolog [Acanthaster planci]
MPFVLICGLPSSGKTCRSKELEAYLVSNHGDREVTTVGDDYIGADRNTAYADSKKEKEIRGTLKSAVIRKLSKDSVLILDSLNYIKGFRYELYCAVKSSQTPHCVIYCDTTANVASEWNTNRRPEERYSQEIFDALVMRFEPPDAKNRWDSPLFTVHAEDELPCQAICDAIFSRKAPPPSLSTVSQPLSATNFLHELDKITQEIVTTLIAAQKTSLPGDIVSIPGSQDKINLTRSVSAAELQRIRRQFITYTKLHPVEDVAKLHGMFVQYLNNGIR